jgi:hypothetical protein
MYVYSLGLLILCGICSPCDAQQIDSEGPYSTWAFNWLTMMGWDWHLRTVAITGLLFIPQVNVSGEPWWRSCWLGITPVLSTRARWQPYQQRHLERAEGMDKGMRILRIQYLWYVYGSFTCCKILRHGTFGFTSCLKEGVLQIFLPLKIHHLGQVWTCDLWVQWQAHSPLNHWGNWAFHTQSLPGYKAFKILLRHKLIIPVFNEHLMLFLGVIHKPHTLLRVSP